MEWFYSHQTIHPGRRGEPGLLACTSVRPSYIKTFGLSPPDSNRRARDSHIQTKRVIIGRVCRLSDFNFSSGCEGTTITHKTPFIFHRHRSGKLYFVIV